MRALRATSDSAAAVVSTLLLLATPHVAFAQHLKPGVVVGGSLTDGFKAQTFTVDNNGTPQTLEYYSSSKDFIIGLSLELLLPLRMSIDVNGLHRQLNLDSNLRFSASVRTWEFPVLAKYRFPIPLTTPFIEAGPAFRTSGNLNGTSPSVSGLAVGSGIELKLWHVGLAPTARYTVWGRDNVPSGSATPVTNPHQLEMLLGIRF